MSEEKKITSSVAASKRITDLYMMLEDNYDRDAKNYRPGWSDERIAKELVLAVDFVVKRREQDYGPLVAPARVVTPEMLKTLHAVQQEATVLRDQAERLRALVGDLIKSAS